jgi:methyl-accepting chemotaxis protein
MAMTIGKKIAAGFALPLAILLLIGVIAYWCIVRLIDTRHAVARTHNVLEKIDQVLSVMKDAETGQRGYVITAKENYLKPYEEAVASIQPALDELARLTEDNLRQQERVRSLRPLIKKKLDELKETIAARGKKGDTDEATLAAARKIVEADKGKEFMGEIRKLTDDMREEAQGQLRERADRAEATALAVKLTIGIGTALAFVLVALAGFFVIRSITTPVRSAVTELTTASTEILASTSQQAAGAQEQAAAVSQTVATVDEVTQTAEQSAQRARGVGEAVQRTVEVGNNGKKAVEESLAAMGKVRQQVEATAENILSLAEQAQAIGDIIATVNDIAEQTNLLALNAAIEASRAGEHGRGFAVVAGEVKALADQSKKATAQVRQILTEIQRATNTAVLSTEEVTKGVAKAIAVGGQAGETIRSLAETLAEVARTAAQIVASVGQQATGMSQIHQAIRNIDQVAKQNAVATRQTVQAADNLNKLGTRLAALTAQ